MSEKAINEALNKISRKLDIIAVILLANSGLTRKEIAEVLEVSEKAIQRLVPISKIKRNKIRKEPEPELTDNETGENEQGKQQ